MPDFQARHYCAIADALRVARLRPNDTPQEAISDLIEDLAERFACDNSKFDRAQFLRACDPAGKRMSQDAARHAHIRRAS